MKSLPEGGCHTEVGAEQAFGFPLGENFLAQQRLVVQRTVAAADGGEVAEGEERGYDEKSVLGESLHFALKLI